MSRSLPSVVLHTASYPYGAGERSFLDREIPALLDQFGEVILVPEDTAGDTAPSLPAGVVIEPGLARDERAGRRTRPDRLLASPDLLREVLGSRAWRLGWTAVLHAARSLVRAQRAADWILRFTDQRDPARLLFYTYWLDRVSVGLCLARRRRPGIRCVSRAHRYDLYAEVHEPPYLPFRAVLLRELDRVFPVSEHGRTYLLDRFPWAGDRVRVARLGVPDPGGLAVRSRDGRLRVVSCSAVIPVKRVERILGAVDLLARARPSQQVEWTHIGGGESEGVVRRMMAGLPGNAICRLPGQRDWPAVLEHYRTEPVDVFVNASASEGVPVTIMETQSFGIPVVAPNVGGMAEIVSSEEGQLLGPDPTPEEIARAIAEVVESDRHQEMRAAARRRWATTYDSSKNFAAFARELRAIRDS